MKSKFKEFNESRGAHPSQATDELMINSVRKLMNISPFFIYSKITISEITVALATLLFCPQFHLGTSDQRVFHFYHHLLGDDLCMLACGATFMSGGALLAAILTTRSEKEFLQSSRFLFLTIIITTLSLFLFIVLGAKAYPLSMLWWSVGSILGSYATFKGVSSLMENLHLIKRTNSL